MQFIRRPLSIWREHSRVQWMPLSTSPEDAEKGFGTLGTRAQRVGRFLKRLLSVYSVLIFAVALFGGFFLYASHRSGSAQPEIQSYTAFPELLTDPLFYPPLPPKDGPVYRPIPALYNTPPPPSDRYNKTTQPLLIPFTRNHQILCQTVLSYIASGWPRDSIIIIDNTGTMTANANDQLTPVNPFYLPYHLYRETYGISILRTHTLLNFAQLQNYMIATALARNWDFFYWAHSDAPILGLEKGKNLTDYRSPYQLAQKDLARLTRKETLEKEPWAVRWYNFDYLTLVNVRVMEKVGAWDTFIPFYTTDCDFYARCRMSGLRVISEHEEGGTIGRIFDVASAVENPEWAFFPPTSAHPPSKQAGLENTPEGLYSDRYQALFQALKDAETTKRTQKSGRNTWQNQLTGGNGEPWTYHPKAFQDNWWRMNEEGKRIFVKKWDSGECALVEKGNKTLGDMWKKEYGDFTEVVLK